MAGLKFLINEPRGLVALLRVQPYQMAGILRRSISPQNLCSGPAEWKIRKTVINEWEGRKDRPKSPESPRMKVGYSAKGGPAWTMRREERAGDAQLFRITQERGAAVRGHLAPSCSQPTVPESCPGGPRRHQLTQRCIVHTWLRSPSSMSDRCGTQTQVIQDGLSLKLCSLCPVLQP